MSYNRNKNNKRKITALKYICAGPQYKLKIIKCLPFTILYSTTLLNSKYYIAVINELNYNNIHKSI